MEGPSCMENCICKSAMKHRPSHSEPSWKQHLPVLPYLMGKLRGTDEWLSEDAVPWHLQPVSAEWPQKNPSGLFFSQFKPVHATIQVREVLVPVQDKERGTHSWDLNNKEHSRLSSLNCYGAEPWGNAERNYLIHFSIATECSPRAPTCSLLNAKELFQIFIKALRWLLRRQLGPCPTYFHWRDWKENRLLLVSNGKQSKT